MMNRCAVVGNPIAHSRSPEIHAQFAAEQGISLHYERILATEDNFVATVTGFFAAGGRGLNITVPFKEHAYRLASARTPDAEAAGAVNTLWQENGILHGDNTDGRGLLRALQEEHHFDPAGKRLLLLGAGGAARGVLLPLLNSHPAALTISNRGREKAEALRQRGKSSPVALTVMPLDATSESPFDLIINATSTGLTGKALPLSPTLVQATTLCYDMVYGHDTPFLQWARAHGCRTADGWSMLVAQARLSFNIWFAT